MLTELEWKAQKVACIIVIVGFLGRGIRLIRCSNLIVVEII